MSEREAGLSFEIRDDLRQEVAVVAAYYEGETVGMQVRPIPQDTPGVHGQPDEELGYVLSTPIYDGYGRIWGTVDFDITATYRHVIVNGDASRAAAVALAKHIRTIIELESNL